MNFDVSFSGWATALIAPIIIPFLSILIPYIRISREEKLLLNPNMQIFTKLVAESGKLILMSLTLIVLGSFEIQGYLTINKFPFISGSGYRFSTPIISFSITVAAVLIIFLLLLRWIKPFRNLLFRNLNLPTKSIGGKIFTVLSVLIFIYAYIFFPIFLLGNTLGVIFFYYSQVFKLNVTSNFEVIGYMFSTISTGASVTLIILWLIIYAVVRLFYGQLIFVGNLLVTIQIIANIKLINNELLTNMSIINTSIDGSSILVKHSTDKEGNKILLPKSSILYIKFEFRKVSEHKNEEPHDDTVAAKEVAATTESDVRILLPPDYK